MLQRNIHTLVALVIAILFWVGHRVLCLTQEVCGPFSLLPANITEFAISSLLFVAIVALGLFADFQKRRLLELHKQNDPRKIHHAMVFAMHHILNNYLNGMELVRMEAQGSKDFDPHVLHLYEEASREAVDLIKKLSQLEDVSEHSILNHVTPQSRPQG